MGGVPNARGLTHTRITWVLSPPALQVPGVTLGSPLCQWCFGHSSWRGARQKRCLSLSLKTGYLATRVNHVRKHNSTTSSLSLSDVFWNLTLCCEVKKFGASSVWRWYMAFVMGYMFVSVGCSPLIYVESFPLWFLYIKLNMSLDNFKLFKIP